MYIHTKCLDMCVKPFRGLDLVFRFPFPVAGLSSGPCRCLSRISRTVVSTHMMIDQTSSRTASVLPAAALLESAGQGTLGMYKYIYIYIYT